MKRQKERKKERLSTTKQISIDKHTFSLLFKALKFSLTQLRSTMALQIFIKSQTTSIKLSVSSTDTVIQVKRKLQKKLGIKVEHQRYFYGYAELKEKDQLRDYNIKHSQLLMMTAITTNGQSQFVFFQIYISTNSNIYSAV